MSQRIIIGFLVAFALYGAWRFLRYVGDDLNRPQNVPFRGPDEF